MPFLSAGDMLAPRSLLRAGRPARCVAPAEKHMSSPGAAGGRTGGDDMVAISDFEVYYCGGSQLMP
jgi:hypothetical protein